MDLAYLRAHPEHLPTFLTHQRIRETPVSGGDICATSRLTLDDGHSIFAKTWPERAGRPAPGGFFAAEAAGLRWLREAGAVAVPEVLVTLPELLALEWVEPGEPSPEAAERFGRELAGLHRAGAPAFGAEWFGFIGALPQDNTPDPGPWPEWFAQRRLLPYLKMSVDNAALTAAEAALVEELVDRIGELGGAEPPARIHGDLWPGNLLWGADDRVRLIDPAAHGGHRETDLAQLALFGGPPHLDRIMAAYQEAWPLADGWRERVPLHQLHLLLVHTALFGAAYRDAVGTAARAALRGAGRATVDR
ncbi:MULTISPECIES: fructosamine kinase family protein [Micromonospora]|uniref:Aminoglycoside phosphotransferase n=1 Tax=Micromonospora solifontis TaxID=2487138 RepID=A0ABX9WIA0_9ACTN|nr:MULTISPECIES: fructosamine kinase family protein [Micromonospora]NES17163.1 phosphotransferase [Micromonospora sp. PPF5-17B]NES36239.1 phosphotransferase [Micromonospora solifontis]NES58952.1 phosphotransferase [Micromonospora sp. PPF5-6]RNL99846.1 aminoglycoside phosphotransferase [Micromonospora solifontis]